MQGVPYFTPYVQDLGGALLMSFQIFYAHVHMHRRIASVHKYTCLLFGTCHTFAEFFHVIYHSTPIKPLRYFGQRLIFMQLSNVTTIKFSAMIHPSRTFIVHPSVTTYNISSVSARYSEVRVVSLHLRYREEFSHDKIILLFLENSPFRSYYKEVDIGLVTAESLQYSMSSDSIS